MRWNLFSGKSFCRFLMMNKGFYPVYDVWLKKYGDDFTHTMTIFDGHADHEDGVWCISADSSNDIPVQKFVDLHDGKAVIILLFCCYPRNKGRVSSQKSLVIYNRSSMNSTNMESRRSKQLMHIPGHGDFVGCDQAAELTAIAKQYGYDPTLI